MTNPNLLRLRCDDTEAVIAPERGALVTSFRVAGRELLYLDEVTFNDASKNVRGGVPLLFPTPGKLASDHWTHAGRSGEMKQHGFARTLPWQIDADTVLDDSRVSLILKATSQTLASYPWRFAASLTCRVKPRALRLELEVTNEDDTAMPFAFGVHPYFSVRDKARAAIQTAATRAFDNVTQTVGAFRGFDFAHGETDIHLLDHGGASASLDLGDGSRIAFECSAEFQKWIVWTLPDRPFICLEPWTALGNALNTGEDLIELEPGHTRSLWIEMRLIRV